MCLLGNCRNISIALKIPEKGEGKAHACEIACLRQLRGGRMCQSLVATETNLRVTGL